MWVNFIDHVQSIKYVSINQVNDKNALPYWNLLKCFSLLPHFPILKPRIFPPKNQTYNWSTQQEDEIWRWEQIRHVNSSYIQQRGLEGEGGGGANKVVFKISCAVLFFNQYFQQLFSFHFLGNLKVITNPLICINTNPHWF